MRKLRVVLFYVVLTLCVLLVFVDKKADAWIDDNDVEGDDDDEEDEEEFDFFSTKLENMKTKPTEYVEVECNEDGCAADHTDASVILSVIERGLVTTKPKVKDILKEHSRVATHQQKRFSQETLGYVTPWNSRGYDLAKQFREKFTYISPVWLQIRQDPQTQTPIVTGTHDIDEKWANDVKTGGGDASSSSSGPLIVPRVVYERNQLASTDVPLIIDRLLQLANAHDFDGFVFEIPVVEGTKDLLFRMGKAFQEANKLLIVVLPQSSHEAQLPFTHDLFEDLAPVVHRFSMNAYDFQAPGPNAPLLWLQATLDAFTDLEIEKIMMGVPFYGYDNADAITGPTYISLLKDYEMVKVRWDAKAHECLHSYISSQDSAHHAVFYPCLQFLHDRLRLYEEYGVGAVIWELGQGLDYFYDLL